MIDLKHSAPQHANSLALLGYLITVNQQIHSYQLEELQEYLNECNTSIHETCLPSILDGHGISVTFEDSLRAFSLESEHVQESMYYILSALANVDDCLDQRENDILIKVRTNSKISPDRCDEIFEYAKKEALSLRNTSNVLFSRPYQEDFPQKNLLQRVIDWFRSLVLRIFRRSPDNKTSTNSDDTDYKAAVEKCAEIATDDFGVVQPSYLRLIDNCNDIVKKLSHINNSISSDTSLSAEVSKVISTFADCLRESVLQQVELANKALDQKKRTIPDFTISLIGRTKAGKSTLHAILTQQGYDKIGTGSQRTTRYNRVYQWNLLRLIDTPGIGSAEKDGRKDDEIAMSVLGESDVVCFVIADDSILKDTLSFMEKVAELNKPIIVLLNHKENIEADVKYKRFITNPTAWLSSDSEDSLQGHVNRIQRYADSKGFGQLVSVYPVFLLPALMAQKPEYAQNSKLLWDSSNLEAFITQLKKWITVSGPLKRSQTLLDGAVQHYTLAAQAISSGETPVKNQISRLESRRPSIAKSLEQERALLLRDVEILLKEKFDLLASQTALSFAEEYYDYDGDLSPKWTDYLKKIGFEKDIETDVKRLTTRFSSKIDDTVREVFEDFYFSFKTSIDNLGIGKPMSFDFRSAAKIIGGLCDVAGSIVLLVLGTSNPIGWVLTIGGLVISFLSGLFKSKEKKRKEKIDKIYHRLSSQIRDNSSNQISEYLSTLKTETDKLLKTIDDLFGQLIDGLKDTLVAGDELANAYEIEIDLLNRVYAWRIVTYLAGTIERYSEDKVDTLITSVVRDVNLIQIHTPVAASFHTEELKDIIAEKIEIKNTEA